MANTGQRAGCDSRRQSRGENKTGSEAANEVADCRRRRNISAHHAESLGQRALDYCQAMTQSLAVSDAAAARTIETNGVYLIEIGHCALRLRDIAEFHDRRDIAIHRIDRLERNQLRRIRIEIG